MYALSDADYNSTTKLIFRPEGCTASTGTNGLATPPHKLNFPFKFKDYSTNVFRAIRALSGIDESDYILSLAGELVTLFQALFPVNIMLSIENFNWNLSHCDGFVFKHVIAFFLL